MTTVALRLGQSMLVRWTTLATVPTTSQELALTGRPQESSLRPGGGQASEIKISTVSVYIGLNEII